MNDMITIDTGTGIVSDPERVEPLPLFSDKHPMLRTKMPEYEVETLPNQMMNNLISRLKLTMQVYNGVGLSANQCGVKQRVFVIGGNDFQMVCINPKVVKTNGEIVQMREGCLSYPGLYMSIPRYDSIDVEFHNENGELQQMNLVGITAHCFQHELDHMDGITFVQKAGPAKLQMARERQQKLIKKMVRSNKNAKN